MFSPFFFFVCSWRNYKKAIVESCMRSLCSTIVSILVFDIFLIFFSSVKNKGICTFGVQLIAFKKSMKFTRLIVYLSLKSHKIVRTSTNFIDSLGAIFWAQNVLMPLFPILLIVLTCTKSILTNFHYLPPTLTNFYHFLPTFILLLSIFTNFHHLLPIFITFYQFLPTFTTFQQLLPTFTTSFKLLYYFYQLSSPPTTYYF